MILSLTRHMEENLNAICGGCDQDELDKRSVNALIRRGLVFVNKKGFYQGTVKGEDYCQI
jgi:hypothetical protein